jgi:hypothetical protein
MKESERIAAILKTRVTRRGLLENGFYLGSTICAISSYFDSMTARNYDAWLSEERQARTNAYSSNAHANAIKLYIAMKEQDITNITQTRDELVYGSKIKVLSAIGLSFVAKLFERMSK